MKLIDGDVPKIMKDAKPAPRSVVRVVARLTFVLSIVTVTLAACGSSSNQSSNRADQLVNEGLKAAQQGNAAQAIQDYQAAIKLNPLQTYAYYDLGVMYQRQNDVADASTAYQKALLINPKYRPALFNLAVLDSTTAPTSALANYQQLNAIDPNDPNVLLNLGLLLRKMGKVDEGNSYIAKAVQLKPALASRVPPTPVTSATSVPVSHATTTTPARETTTTRVTS